MIRVRPLNSFRFPIIAECLSPDDLVEKSVKEIGQLKVWEGNRQRNLGELFSLEECGDAPQSENSTTMTIEGDLTKVRKIGYGMQSGEIIINGNVGMHLGEEMKGGKITVNGDVGSWAGSMIKNGSIEIHGNAGSYLGAPYRGSTVGMQNGTITVFGNVGHEAGAHMKKGTIKIYGNAGQFTGFRMQGGTILVQGDSDERVGACMSEGKIVVGGTLQSVLPSFSIDGIRPKVKIDENETAPGPFYVFVGDLADCGNGRLYVSETKNPQLSLYEKFL
jgi:formylmethanofuran dehydrogenase subunit C